MAADEPVPAPTPTPSSGGAPAARTPSTGGYRSSSPLPMSEHAQFTSEGHNQFLETSPPANMLGSPLNALTTSSDRGATGVAATPYSGTPASGGRPTPRSGARNDLHPSGRVFNRSSSRGFTSQRHTTNGDRFSDRSGSSGRATPNPTSEGNDGGFVETFVWGTNVNIDQCTARFRRFIENFTLDDALTPAAQVIVTPAPSPPMSPARDAAEAGSPPPSPPAMNAQMYTPAATPSLAPFGHESFYQRLIREVIEQGGNVFNLDCKNLRRWDRWLYDNLVRYPEELIPIFDIVVDDTARALYDDQEPPRRLQVRVFNMEETKQMRALDPQDVGQLVSIEGMVTRVAPINPDLKQAFFRCNVCAKEMPVFVDKGKVDEPKQCPSCGTKHAFQLVHNRCQFADRQGIKLQENADEMPQGETPHTMSMLLYDSLVDNVKPGDKVEVTGVFRAVPVRESARTRVLKSTFRTYVDVVHVRKTDASRLAEEGEETAAIKSGEFYDSDKSKADLQAEDAAMRALAAEGDIYETLTKSVAPSIFELDDIKKGVLCQLFGGTHKDLTKSGGGRRRGEVNVLLVGDPGTSKSQLLSYVHKIAPRGIYTSGRGSSAVGLTAYVSKDPDTKEAVLESGALVLSDRGVCCIDEFDKMSDSSRSVLHEVMEQQTVSIAKAGIICTLNARTSVLACANPVGSRYNPRMSVIDNIQLPPSLLSRFDLVYLVLDRADDLSDRRLAKHLVSLHSAAPPEAAKGAIPLEKLTQYVSYARAACHPKISDEAASLLVDKYVEMRQLGSSRKVISATPRQLESLVRMSEALARMKLADEVVPADVEEAVRLMKVAMQQSATDSATGAIDMDLLTTGVSASARQHQKQLEKAVSEAYAERRGADGSVSLGAIAAEVAEKLGMKVTNDELREAITSVQGIRLAGGNIVQA